MSRWFKKFSPQQWALLVFVLIFGVLTGIGTFTFGYGKGFSYFSTNPAACANCHIMQPQYDSWQKGPHHIAATCVDCHLPHDFVGKYIAKADNGYRHSKAFTFMDFHEPIQMTQRNRDILQANCLQCHADFVHNIVIETRDVPGGEMRCVHCHRGVGHGARG